MSAKNEPTLNELIQQFDELQTWFGRDDMDIEQSIEKFEQASHLAEKIQLRLKEVDNKITILKTRFDEA